MMFLESTDDQCRHIKKLVKSVDVCFISFIHSFFKAGHHNSFNSRSDAHYIAEKIAGLWKVLYVGVHVFWEVGMAEQEHGLGACYNTVCFFFFLSSGRALSCEV